MSEKLKIVDHTAIKVNQITIIILSIIAFILDEPWITLMTSLVMLIGTIIGKPGFIFLYNRILKPLKLAKPKVFTDNPEPHRFAQGVGFTFLFTGSLSVFLGSTTLGWTLTWVVIILAALNAFGGFCAGCFVYYWLSRLNFPGFTQHPPEGTFPGMRPKDLEAHES